MLLGGACPFGLRGDLRGSTCDRTAGMEEDLGSFVQKEGGGADITI